MTATTYQDFLAAKTRPPKSTGLEATPDSLANYPLHPFQRHIAAWAIRRGRAAIWADTGLGKTRMQLAWADRMTAAADGRALILAPLAVTRQTVLEAADKMGIQCDYVPDATAVLRSSARIVIANYERLHLIDPAEFTAVALDESSILKDVTTKTRDLLINTFAATPYRLACTATPAPNDITEIANHAEFLGIAKRRHMLATYFANDMKGNWRVKGHAANAMWRWVATWAIAARKPSDLGFDDDGYDLPPLDIQSHLLDVNDVPDGQLFATDLGGVGQRSRIRRETLEARCARAAQIVGNEPDEPWLLWCGMNDEADLLARLIPGAVNVHGAMTAEQKADLLLAFARGEIRVLITKPKIAGFGMNFQHCARIAFVGLGDSYEAYYQAIRRCWRYGQDRQVDVHIVLSTLEGQIAANVVRKETAARTDQLELIAAQRQLQEAS